MQTYHPSQKASVHDRSIPKSNSDDELTVSDVFVIFGLIMFNLFMMINDDVELSIGLVAIGLSIGYISWKVRS